MAGLLDIHNPLRLCFSSADSNLFYRYADTAWTLVE